MNEHRMPRRIRITGALTAIVTVLLAAPQLHADSADDPVAHARALEAAAETLEPLAPEWDRVAALYREAADLRPAHDPIKVRNLRRSAQIRYLTGDRSAAMRDAREAGELARRQGDVPEAAHAFLDAALIASELGRAREAHRFMEEARLLARSPLLQDTHRAGIQERIHEAA